MIDKREYNKQYAIDHGEEARERARQWRKDNPVRTQKNNKHYYKQNRERELAKSHERYEKNKERDKERSRLWRQNNRDKVLAQIAKRRAAKKKAIPKWADMERVRSFYKEAIVLTEQTGTEYQVDHIVPLSSDVVCGLHWEGNLRVITARENNSKKTKLLEELL